MMVLAGTHCAWGQHAAVIHHEVDVISQEDRIDHSTNQAQTNGCFVFCETGQAINLLAYVGPMTNHLVIPSTLAGRTVLRIDQRAFYKRGFAQVTLPSSISEIGPFAFGECTNLVHIVLPDNVRRIDDFSFMNCSRLTTVSLPDNLEEIGKMAFAGCERLTQINFPKHLEQIADGAFIQTKLTQIETSILLMDIGVGAFAQCNHLTNVVLGASGVTLHANAFAECANLSEVTFLGTVKEIGTWAFMGCPHLQHVRFKIPTFRIIDPTAFKDSPHVSFYQFSKEGDAKIDRVSLFQKEDQTK